MLEVEFAPKINVPKPRVPQAPYYEAHLICEIMVSRVRTFVSYIHM
jgi:hypothetical protein